MKELCMIILACFSVMGMQAQEIKTVKAEVSDDFPTLEPSLDFEDVSSRPMLGGFPVLQDRSYYSEKQEPWMSEDGKPLRISPNAIPKYENPQLGLYRLEAYYAGSEVPGLMNKQSSGFMYRQNIGRFTFSPYLGMEKMNTGVYGFGNLTKATFGSTMSYQVNDWLTVGLYGQFVPMNTGYPQSIIMSPFMPKSNYGGFIEMMFNRHWGVGAKMG